VLPFCLRSPGALFRQGARRCWASPLTDLGLQHCAVPGVVAPLAEPGGSRLLDQGPKHISGGQSRLLLRWCVLALGVLVMPVGVASADVVLRGRSNGFPGARAQEDTVLTIALKGPRLRVMNPPQYYIYTVDLEAGRTWEFDAYHRVYQERTVASFEEFREARRRQQRKQIDSYKKLSKAGLREQARLALQRDGVELDGSVRASTEKPGKTRVFELLIDGVKRKVECYSLRIRENRAHRPVFDMWLCKGLKVKDSLLQFYELGTFSKPVLAELKKVVDFPVRIEATVDSGSFKKRVFCEILSLEHEAVPAWKLQVPAGLKKVPDLAKELERISVAQQKLRKRPKQEAVLPCDQCKKPIKGRPVTTRLNGRKWKFCGVSCRTKFIIRGGLRKK